MSESQTFVLSDRTYERAALAVKSAPFGWVVTISEPTRNKQQNAAAHAALQDISQQMKWHGRKLSVLVWKRLTIASFLRELGEQVELMPALDGNGFDVIYEHSSEFGVKKCSAWLEWIYAFGTQNGVVFRDRHHVAA